jgi:hypothetical protein
MNKNIRLSKEVVTINGHPVKKIYGGFGDHQPCILAKQVAELHGQKLKRINELVNNNMDWFDEGIDYVDLKSQGVLKEQDQLVDFLLNFYSQEGLNRSVHIYLFSQQGYALLCKLLKSDLAKQVYKTVIREYFVLKSSDKWIDSLPRYITSTPVRYGFVYIIQNQSGKVKIGRTTNPSERVRTVQTQGGFKTDTIFVSEKLTDFEAAEIMLHNHFKKHHFIGEWFDISFEEAVEAYRQIINNMLDAG